MKIAVKLGFLCILVLGMTACFSPVKTKGDKIFMLEALPCDVIQKPSKRSTIFVAPPDTIPVYDTTQMAYTKRLFEINYFVFNHWGETPGQMLQPLIVQTLERTNHFRAVVTLPYAGHYDYLLNTQILNLIQDFRFCPAIAKLKIAVQLIKANSNRIVTHQTFEVDVPLRTNPPYGGVIAANKATTEMLNQIAYLVVMHTR